MRIKIQGHTTVKKISDAELLAELERAYAREDSPFKLAWINRLEAELERR